MIITGYDAFILSTVFTVGLLLGHGIVGWILTKFL